MGFLLVTVRLWWLRWEDGRRSMKLEDRPNGGVALRSLGRESLNRVQSGDD